MMGPWEYYLANERALCRVAGGMVHLVAPGSFQWDEPCKVIAACQPLNHFFIRSLRTDSNTNQGRRLRDAGLPWALPPQDVQSLIPKRKLGNCSSRGCYIRSSGCPPGPGPPWQGAPISPVQRQRRGTAWNWSTVRNEGSENVMSVWEELYIPSPVPPRASKHPTS